MYSTAFCGCFEREHPGKTSHRWFQAWVRQGVFKQILTELGEDLYRRGGIDIRDIFIDGSFTLKKRGHLVGITKHGKGTTIMAIADASGLPLIIDIQSASPHEVKLVETTIESRFISQPAERMTGERLMTAIHLMSAFGNDMEPSLSLRIRRTARSRKPKMDGY